MKGRTKEILLRYLPPAPAVIYDIGGATGIYSFWLAELGYEVHLQELSPANVDRARELLTQQADHPLASVEVADARSIPRLRQSDDAVLVMGPLYHLSERADRVKALQEAWRVLIPGGLLASTAVTRYGSLL
jgi:SAM-dependent methyltransferase